MKKLAIVAVAAVLAMALAGCASGGASGAASSAASSAAAESPGVELSASSAEMMGMPNPWGTASSAEEAAEGAGIESGFVAGEDLVIGDLKWREVTYRYMENVAEADYDGGAVSLDIRKGQGLSGQEFTGDYTDYEHTWTAEAEGVTFQCSGQEPELANLVEWSVDGCSFAAYCMGLGGENYGISAADLVSLATQIK